MSASKRRHKPTVKIKLEKRLKPARDPIAEQVTKIPSGPMNCDRFIRKYDWLKEEGLDDFEFEYLTEDEDEEDGED